MKKTLTKKQTLRKLGIKDFSQLTPNNIMQVSSLLGSMEPEVAKEALEQFPEFSSTVVETVKGLKETAGKTLDEDSKSASRFYDLCDEITAALKDSLKNDNLSFEEKKYYIEKLEEIAVMAGEKDSEGKKFKEAILLTTGVIFLSAVALVSGTIGGGTNIKLPVMRIR